MDDNSCLSKFCKLIKDYDMFGKEANLYYNGEEKKTTWFGKFLTKLYLLMYIVFLHIK